VLPGLQLIEAESKTMMMGQRVPQLEYCQIALLGVGEQARVREVIRGSVFVSRPGRKISLDDPFPFDLVSLRGHGHGCNEVTRRVKAKACSKSSTDPEPRARFSRDTDFN